MKKIQRLLALSVGLNALILFALAVLVIFQWRNFSKPALNEHQFTYPHHLENLITPIPAPKFSLTSLDGQEVSLDGIRSSIIFIDVWGTFCEPCIEMIPFLKKIHQDYKGKNMTLLSVAVDDDIGEVRKFVKEHKISYPVLLAPGMDNAFNVGYFKNLNIRRTFPTMLIINKDRQIVERIEGWGDGMEQTITDKIEKWLKETP